VALFGGKMPGCFVDLGSKRATGHHIDHHDFSSLSQGNGQGEVERQHDPLHSEMAAGVSSGLIGLPDCAGTA